MRRSWVHPNVAALALRKKLREQDARLADVCASPYEREQWQDVRPGVLRAINRLENTFDQGGEA